MYSASDKNTSDDKSSDMRGSARRLKRDLRDAADNAHEDLEDLAHQAGKEARGLMGDAEKNVFEMAGSMTSKISDNPIQSSLVSLGIGLVLGLVLSRR